MRKVDDNGNSVFKHDRFLMSFQVFKSYIATIIRQPEYEKIEVEKPLRTCAHGHMQRGYLKFFLSSK